MSRPARMHRPTPPSPCRAACQASLVALVVGLLAAPLPARAWSQDLTEFGMGRHWPRSQVSVHLANPVPGLPDGGAAVLARAAATWGAPACTALRLTVVAPGAPADIAIGHPHMPWPHAPEDAAWTEVAADPASGAMVQVRIDLNRAFAFSAPGATHLAAAPTAVDLEAVLLHELGHAVGLGHALDRAAVMSLGIRPDRRPKRSLGADDVAGVCKLYPVAGPGVARPVHQSSQPVAPDRRAVWLALAAALGLAAVLVALLVAWRRRRP